MASIYVKEKKNLKGIRGMLLAITLTNLILTLIMNIIFSFTESPYTVYIQATAVGLGAYLIPIMIYALRNKITAEKAGEKFCLKGCVPYIMLLGILLGFGCQFVQIAANLPLSGFSDQSSVILPKDMPQLITACFVVAVLPSIFEEFLFRGIVYCSMAELNKKAAFIFSSIMFAVMHASLSGFLGYLIMGFVSAYLVSVTKSLYPSMLFHFANNATALLLAYFNDALWYSAETMLTLFVCGLAAFAFGIFAITVICNQKSVKKSSDSKFDHKNGNRKYEKSSDKIGCAPLLGQSFISLPIILCIAFTVIGCILIRII